MDRLITTHRLRKVCEPTPLWSLSTLDEGGLSAPETVMVPAVWESLPALKRYQGRGVYEKKLSCGGTLRLVFGGVGFRARVWLDDTLLGSHYGAYGAFDFVVEDLPFGEHTLRVEADNRFTEDSALHVPNDYYSYGGITRPVTIEQLGSAYITDLRVTPVRRGRMWQAEIAVTVKSLCDTDQPFDLECKAGPGAIHWKNRHLPARGEVTLTATLSAPGARPWSPENPRLYAAEAVLWLDGEPADDLCDRFGFREFKVEGDQLLLNGQPVFIKGVNRHEDYADFGSAVPVEAMVRDVHLIRGLGCNLVRTSHYPNDPRFLDLCDQYGLMVWEEAHARGLNLERMRHPQFMQQTMLSLHEMLTQHHNHPSIVLWGCLNECMDHCEEGAACFRACFSEMHRLDPSRPATAALLDRKVSILLGDCDVVSMNLYPLWYHNTPAAQHVQQTLAWAQQNGAAGKPYIISEIGAGAIPGYHDPFGMAKWSEERQAAILREQIEAAYNTPGVNGIILWQFCDVRVDESEWFAIRPRTYNNKGLVDQFRQPKLAYSVVRELFHKK